MTRYLVAWHGPSPKPGEAPNPPFKYWPTGYWYHADGRRGCSYCAAIDANSETDAWKQVEAHFPGADRQACIEKASDWPPEEKRFF